MSQIWGSRKILKYVLNWKSSSENIPIRTESKSMFGIGDTVFGFLQVGDMQRNEAKRDKKYRERFLKQ